MTADVIVVGAGPVGLACGIEVQRLGLTALLLEKGALANSLVGYPTNMEFFSTPDLLEIGDHPFPTQRYKPVREDALDYYRRVAEAEKLEIRLFEPVLRVDGADGAFEIKTAIATYTCTKLIVATGFFDVPNRLNIPGEELAKVEHYYRDPFKYAFQNVAVIGGKNSAAKVALECYRHGANVTLVVRGAEIGPSVKYWIRPDLLNRIEEGAIAAYFDTTVSEITKDAIGLRTPDGPLSVPNDWVLAMTGYRPDYAFLRAVGIGAADDEARTPFHDSVTFETNRMGMYLAGTVCGGLNTSRWFIENGRFHAQQIAAHIAGRLRARRAATTTPQGPAEQAR